MIIGANVDYAISDGWRGPDGIAGSKAPQGLAGFAVGGIKGIEVVIIGANID